MAGVPTWLTAAGLLLIFAVPGQVLDLAGFGYASPSGNAAGKVHPGTDLIVLATCWAAVRAGNPLRYLAAEGRRFPGVVVLLAATLLLLVYLIKVEQAPFTPLIDTFVLPCLLFPLLIDLSPEAKRWIEGGLHVFLAINAGLGIVEFMAGWRLVPLTFNGFEITTTMDWRASGLLGHPLASASTAGMYCAILAMGFGRVMPDWLRPPAVALQFMSLAAFGGRTALVMTVVFLLLLLLWRGKELLQGRRFSRRACAIALLLTLALVLGAFLLVAGGFFDQLADRFADDNGSARSRALIFDAFMHLTPQEFWLGPDQDHVASILHLEGIEVGVESFWLGLVMLCGFCMSALFFTAFAVFLFDVMRLADLRALVPLLFYMTVISTTVSLSVKSASLAQFVTLVIVLMPASRRTAFVAAVSPQRVWKPA